MSDSRAGQGHIVTDLPGMYDAPASWERAIRRDERARIAKAVLGGIKQADQLALYTALKDPQVRKTASALMYELVSLLESTDDPEEAAA